MDKFTNGLKALLGDKKLLITVIVHFGLSFLFFIAMFFPFFRYFNVPIRIYNMVGGWFYLIVWILAFLAYPVLIILDMKKIAWIVLLGQAGYALVIFFISISVYLTYAANSTLGLGFFFEIIFIAAMALAGLLEKTVMDFVFKTLSMK